MGAASQTAMAAVPAVHAVDADGNRAYAMADAAQIIGSRPSDCPHSYCGCGLRKYLGLEDKRLNLASNWARLFPRESGPRAGLGEINLPAMQPGSSIMPGKVNPVIPEVVNQVCFDVIGGDVTGLPPSAVVT